MAPTTTGVRQGPPSDTEAGEPAGGAGRYAWMKPNSPDSMTAHVSLPYR
jgi:hypothetical protein